MKQALVLNERDTKRVLTHISRSTYAKRNRAMFQLSWLAGMRVGEIAALKVSEEVVLLSEPFWRPDKVDRRLVYAASFSSLQFVP